MQVTRIQRYLLGTILLCYMALVGPTTAKDPLPESGGVKQLEADIKYLVTGLNGKKKNALSPLKSMTMLIAINAQNQTDGTDGEKMAGVRDQALKVMAALAKSEADWETAIKEAEAMSGAKGDVKKVIKLQEQNEFDIHELMTVFKPKNRGGRGLEQEVLNFSKSISDPKTTIETANLVILIGQYSELMTPADTSDANKKKWLEWSQEMQKFGQEAAEAGLKGDKAAAVKKFQAINKNCTDCHNVFKK
jgi:hypothetical protein